MAFKKALKKIEKFDHLPMIFDLGSNFSHNFLYFHFFFHSKISFYLCIFFICIFCL